MEPHYDFPSFSIDRYRMLVEEAQDIIFETDEAGYFTFVNGMATTILGFSRSELLKMHFLDLVEESYQKNVSLFYTYQIESKERVSFLEFPIRTKQGSIEWVGQKVQIIFKNEAYFGTIGITRIQTERHNLENGLKLSEEKYRGILDNLQFGLMEVDLNERIIFVNDTMTRITGFSKEEMMGQIASELLVRPETKKTLDEQHHLREKNKASAYEVEIIRKDGTPFFGLISGAPTFDLIGRRTGSIGLHVDITERKKNELELHQIKRDLDRYTQGLELLNRAGSDLSLTPDQQLKDGLKIVSEYFDLPLGGVFKAEGDQLIVIQSIQNSTLSLEYRKAFPINASVSGIAFMEERLIAISDMEDSPFRDSPVIIAAGLKCLLCMPIFVNRRKYGTILFCNTERNKSGFSAYDLQFFKMFARYVGFVLTSEENKQALLEQQKTLLLQNQELSESKQFLYSLNNFVTKLLDQDDLLSISWEIVENVIHDFGFTDCVIYILNDDKGYLEQLAAYGAKDAGERKIKDPIVIPFGKGVVGSVALSGIGEIISDTSKDPRYIPDDEVRLSEITVPIIFENKVIGIIDSEHPDPHFFTEKHLETLTIIANLAASRLKNAKSKLRQEIAEKELRESENKLRRVINSAQDAIITINEQGVITEWNPQATKIFGWKKEEVLGQSLTQNIIPSKYSQKHHEGMSQYLATGQGPALNQRVEMSAIHKSGREFPVELFIIPMTADGVHSFTAFARDITIQKNLKEEMEKALTQERELNELKSRFVSMTSHEFRTPLTTIKQNVDLIEYSLEIKNPELYHAFSSFFTRISFEITRVTSLMNDMLLLGKIEAGKVEITKKPSDLVIFSHQLIQRITAGRTDGRTILLKIEGLKRTVNIDVVLMEHIISNLLTNALKYSEGKADPILTLSFEIQSSVQIIIQDFGIGIPVEDQKGLFSSFFRAKNVRNIQGSGLGLSIVKEFVEMHGGYITVSSEINKGAEFIVVIPVV
jgi:PAS domain S-box-containing protein